MRLMVKGVPSKPFSVQMLPPPVFVQDEGRMDKIKKLSRERYSEERKMWNPRSAVVSSARESHVTAKTAGKMKEKEEEEKKKAKAKNMSLDEYRKWRDREMC